MGRDNTLPDQVAGMKDLARQYPFIDIERAAMWGHSGGGMVVASVIEYFPGTYDGAMPLESLAIVLMPSGRALLNAWFARRTWWGVPVVVLGAGKTGQLVLRQMRDNPSLGLKPVACFDEIGRAHV